MYSFASEVLFLCSQPTCRPTWEFATFHEIFPCTHGHT